MQAQLHLVLGALTQEANRSLESSFKVQPASAHGPEMCRSEEYCGKAAGIHVNWITDEGIELFSLLKTVFAYLKDYLLERRILLPCKL